MDLQTNPSIDQEQMEYLIDSNPELQRTEGNPTVAKVMMWHPKVYKSLATLGDFVCFVWYYDHDYDPLRVSTGSKRIHIIPSEENRIEDGLLLNDYFCVANDVWSEGVIYVNPIIRRNGTKFQNNKDLKDCVKYMSGVAAHYGADPSKIVAIDQWDNHAMYEMSYDLSSSAVYGDVSNDVYSNYTSGPVGNGSLSKNYDTVFSSGSISMSDIHNNFGAGYALGSYYRGSGIADISQNSHVPTSGSISFNNLRGCVGKITANANGNWSHAQARWELFSQTEWDSGVTKVINCNGNFGSMDKNNPALRFNNSGGGNITVNVNNTSGNPVVRGYSGERGGANGGGGDNGGLAMHVASPVNIPSGHFNSRIRAGGGGGGGGGQGGQGGGGGNNGGWKCSGWFCHSQYRWCHHGSGGTGGTGGTGGQGGRGNGYHWDPSNNWWVDAHGAGLAGGSNGAAGAAGGWNAGTGGTGGTGGSGGGFESGGNNGGTGGTGTNGGGAGAGCGGYPGGQAGKAGSAGGSGGGAGTKYTTSHAGSVNTT